MMKENFVHGFKEIKTANPKMIEALKMAQKAARCESNVLITGESGTGKELVARGIHRLSSRAKGHFLAVNCGAIPENLLESELMGYERGAFTGALSRKIGDFESANGGTIFLDEIGTLSLTLQAKLLRVIQEREIKRIGANKTIKLDVRIIAATNEDLEKKVAQSLFREDLYFRLNVIPIHLPPLRERKEDIPILLKHFINKICSKLDIDIMEYSEEVVTIFRCYKWPGNVREFENTVERIVILNDSKKEITIKDVPRNIVLQGIKEYSFSPEQADSLREKCIAYEKGEIIKALHDTGWNRLKAAKKLKMHRNTLFLKMKKYGIILPKEYK